MCMNTGLTNRYSRAATIAAPYDDLREVVVAMEVDGEGKNPIMLLNEIALSFGFHMDWSLVSESGAPHERQYTWRLKLAEYEAVGTGASKKVAKSIAAAQLYEQLPDEVKERKKKEGKTNNRKRKKEKEPKATAAAGKVVAEGGKVIGPVAPGKKAKTDITGKPVHSVILNANPISCLYEYCKRGEFQFKISGDRVRFRDLQT